MVYMLSLLFLTLCISCRQAVSGSQTSGCDANAACTKTLTSFNCVCNEGYIVSGGACQDCKEPLGLENGDIPDSRITASSVWDDKHEAYYARLNNTYSEVSIGAWVPKGGVVGGDKYNLKFQAPGTIWIQVQLVPQQYVTGIITQGRPAGFDQYITSYTIKYSDDGINFKAIPGTFKGNSDSHTSVTNLFPQRILTSYIRLYPMTWEFAPTLRMELLGCAQ